MKINSFNTKSGKVLDSLLSSKYIQKKCELKRISPVVFDSKNLLESIVSKDLVGCAVYTYLSWNNKKIPEEKRKFVALTDLTNGIIMVGGQILAGKIIEKKWGPAIYGKYFSGEKGTIDKQKGIVVKDDIPGSKAPLAPDNVRENVHNFMKNNVDELKKRGLDVADKKQAKEVAEQAIKTLSRDGARGKAIASGFTIIVTALGTTALVKRTLAPLLSTPAASWIKHKYVDEKPFKDDSIVTSKSIQPQQKPVDVKA